MATQSTPGYSGLLALWVAHAPRGSLSPLGKRLCSADSCRMDRPSLIAAPIVGVCTCVGAAGTLEAVALAAAGER